MTLDVFPCDELLLEVDVALGVPLGLADGSCELEALSLPEIDPLDDTLPLAVKV